MNKAIKYTEYLEAKGFKTSQSRAIMKVNFDIVKDLATKKDIENLSGFINQQFLERGLKFDQKLKGLDSKFDQKFREQESRLDQRFKEINSKFDHRFKEIESKFDQRFKEQSFQIDLKFKEMELRLGEKNLKMASALLVLFITLNQLIDYLKS